MIINNEKKNLNILKIILNLICIYTFNNNLINVSSFYNHSFSSQNKNNKGLF